MKLKPKKSDSFKFAAISFFLLMVISASSQKNNAIFLHHSTGGDLYSQGKVADWVKTYNSTKGTNFQIDIRTYPDTPYPWANYPYDYWKLWVNNTCDNTNPNIECLASIARNYDLVIYKHCYPGASINADIGQPNVASSRQSLENYKLQYRALRTLMDGMPTKKFMVWTLVPLHRLATDANQAKRAYEFVNWVNKDWLTEDGIKHPNIFIFDFYSLAAELNPNPANGQQYCLKYEYEYSHSSSDSHPNYLANKTIGPIFAQAVVDVLAKDYYVSKISVSSQTGENAISINHGTMQMQASILPEDAKTKSVTWSVTNQTGAASIDSTGLLTAEKNGIVKVIAKANDGSGVIGELLITLTNQSIQVQNITVSSPSRSQINIFNGTLQLLATILPEDATLKSVNWSVSDLTGKASINSSGLLTAEKDGIVKVIATATDGSGTTGELQISITNQKILVSQIQIIDNLKSDTINGINKQINLQASIIPLNATNQKIEWLIENITGKASIDENGVLITSAPGTIKVIAKAIDDSKCTGLKEYMIIIPVKNKNEIRSNQVRIYPNPAKDKIKIQIDNLSSDGVTIELRNTHGQVLLKKQITANLTEWPLSNYPSSLYFITVTDNKNTTTYKIVNSNLAE